MIDDNWNEAWKDVVFDDAIAAHEKYRISNFGRLLNCKQKETFLVKPGLVHGYETIALKQKKNGKDTVRYIHKLVAQHFLEQKDARYVVHLNFDKRDNRVENLKWVNKKEKGEHQFRHPRYKNWKPVRGSAKLTESQVKLIKRKINNPNRKTRLKVIAKMFGISEMQLYRIKTGENWASVTED